FIEQNGYFQPFCFFYMAVFFVFHMAIFYIAKCSASKFNFGKEQGGVMQKTEHRVRETPEEFRKKLFSFVAVCMFLGIAETGDTFPKILKKLKVDRWEHEKELKRALFVLEKEKIVIIEPFSSGRILAIRFKQQKDARKINDILNAQGKYGWAKKHIEEALYTYFFEEGDTAKDMSVKIGISPEFSSKIMARMKGKEKRLIEMDRKRIKDILEVKKIFYTTTLEN
ncbi:MAG: hypothetical protein Q8O39_01740, partial [bacterium]|nr:hypothetical protein [bacterium]